MATPRMNTLSDSVRLIASRFGAGDPPKAETELLVRFVAAQFGKKPEDVRLLLEPPCGRGFRCCP